MSLSDLQDALGPALTGALERRGFAELTPVQVAVLDTELEGRDLRITSKTGSGKTVAIGFVVRGVVVARPESPVAVVITPTRELAKQVEEELAWLFEPVGAKVASVTGGSSYRDERRALGDKPAIIVGTPGRLLDHLQRGSIDASSVAAVVLDEADRMLDLGFRDDIEAILGFAPDTRRTHLVSATFSREVRALADRVQTSPHLVEGTPLGAANEDIDHVIHIVRADERLGAIVNLLLATPGSQTVIFARTRADVADIWGSLRDEGFVMGMLSGEMDQPERNRALADFRRGHIDALVATDVAARGIDVQDIGRVIHAEPPNDVDAYTHRSGRTGRAGKKGTSSVLTTPAGLAKTERLLQRARVAFRIEPIPTSEHIRTLRDERVLDLLTREPDADASASGPEEPDAHLEALAERLVESGQVKRAIARLLMRARAAGPAKPRDLTTITPPSRKMRPQAAFQTFADGPRERRHSEGPREAYGERDRSPARPQQDFDLFRVAWGQAHGADARRLLAMVCRRGGIQSRDIGAIRIARTYSTVEVATNVATSFEIAASEPDPRDARATIKRAAKGGDAPHAPPPPPRAPSAPPPPPPPPPALVPSEPPPPPPRARPSSRSTATGKATPPFVRPKPSSRGAVSEAVRPAQAARPGSPSRSGAGRSAPARPAPVPTRSGPPTRDRSGPPTRDRSGPPTRDRSGPPTRDRSAPPARDRATPDRRPARSTERTEERPVARPGPRPSRPTPSTPRKDKPAERTTPSKWVRAGAKR